MTVSLFRFKTFDEARKACSETKESSRWNCCSSSKTYQHSTHIKVARENSTQHFTNHIPTNDKTHHQFLSSSPTVFNFYIYNWLFLNYWIVFCWRGNCNLGTGKTLPTEGTSNDVKNRATIKSAPAATNAASKAEHGKFFCNTYMPIFNYHLNSLL